MSILEKNLLPDVAGFRYIGRFDDRDPQKPRYAWQGCTIEFRLCTKSPQALLKFEGTWRNWLQVEINGQTRIVEIKEAYADYPLDFTAIPADSDGAWHVKIFKRTEAYGGELCFLGLQVSEDATLLTLPPRPDLRIEIYGDSISAGACNEDPGEDQYDTLETHNNYLSYGAITARALNAEYSNCAISGMGVCESWNEYKARMVWDKVRLQDLNLSWDFKRWQADIVVVNLGQNDDGFPASEGRPFPEDFTQKYLDLIRNLHAVYPRAHIVHASGGMPASFQSEGLKAGLKKAFAVLESEGIKTHYFVFEAFSYNHPRVEIHQKMADQLIAYIKENLLID